MNSKKGAVCAFLYNLISKFGKKQKVGYLIDFPITNEDIAGFCGISTRNSVNRILSELKKEKIIDIVDQRIHILDIEYLFGFVLE
nr:helix-turn-helix domain-containing protein [Clostridium niameyense]